MHKSYLFPSSNQRGVPTAYQSKPNGTSGPCREHLQTGSHRFSRKKTAGATSDFSVLLQNAQPKSSGKQYEPSCKAKAACSNSCVPKSSTQELRPQQWQASQNLFQIFSIDHSESSILDKKIHLLASYLYILPLVAKHWSTKVSNQGWPRQIWVVRRFWFALPGFVLVSGSLVGLGSWIFWVKF